MPDATRFDTISDLIDAGGRARLWCFRCARGDDWPVDKLLDRLRVDPATPLRGLARRFRCRRCRMKDQVLLLPASGPPLAPGHGSPSEMAVAAFFHACRRAARDRRR